MMIAAIVVAVLTFLMFSPTFIVVQYTDKKFFVYVRLLYLIKFFVIKDKSLEPESAKKAEKKEHEKTSPQYTVSERLEQLKIVFKLLANLLKQFCKHFKLYRLGLRINVSGDDPADVATEYGLVNALAYSIISFLNDTIRIGKKEIQIGCDYDDRETSFEIDLRFRVVLINFVLVLICTSVRDIITLLKSLSKPHEIQQEVK
ncbi:MAG: hypothetical protein IJN42_03460 [Clostridia bacterium]|nr:hypothetical protein [Clostridia bacterium]